MELLWAKPPVDGGGNATLAAHTRRVVEAVDSVLAQRPAVSSFANHPCFTQWALLAAAFHDLGKAATGFQRMVLGGPRWGERHEVLSVGFLAPFADQLGQEAVDWISAAILSHHRDADFIAERYGVYAGPPDMDPFPGFVAQVTPDAYDSVMAWLVDDWLPAIPRLTLCGRLAEPSCLSADFIRARLDAYQRKARAFSSYLDHPGQGAVRLAVALRGVLIMADHAASAGHPELSPSPLGLPPPVYTRIGLSPEDLRGHQREAPRCPSSALLCAPTGSGKTEAALSWAEAARPSRDPAARLFYVLPYQASMNAMYDRLVRRYGFPREQVALSHGRSLQVLYAREMAGEEGPAAAESRARYLADLARLHRCAMRVLSPYQLLKAAYRIKGYEALLVDLAGADLIVDEVHAYEPERAGLILGLFRFLAQTLDVRFFVMTATLPALFRDRLSGFLPNLMDIRASAEDFAHFRRHRVRICEGDWTDPSILDHVEAAAASGQSVLCCCNTIAGAQELRQVLTRRLGRPVELLHGGFNARDRNRKEQALTSAAFSPLLVATQVVEVSLDVSFDTAFTEPAPLDALLQRFGRANRRPSTGRIVDVHVLTHPDDGQGVYDPSLVTNTLALLQEENGQVIDEALTSQWLDRVYTPDIAARWSEAFDCAARDFERGVLDALAPFQSDQSLEERFYQAFDGVDVLPACLEPEFQALAALSPLRAAELLVPISFSRLARLRRAGLVSEPDRTQPPVVHLPYSPDDGLARSTPKR